MNPGTRTLEPEGTYVDVVALNDRVVVEWLDQDGVIALIRTIDDDYGRSGVALRLQLDGHYTFWGADGKLHTLSVTGAHPEDVDALYELFLDDDEDADIDEELRPDD